MRDYGVVRVRFWEWAKRKKLSVEARDLALYLLTSPHGNSLGCFRLPMAYLCEDLGAEPAAAAKTMEQLQQVGFVHVDEDGSGWVWIVDYLQHNPIPNSNVGKAVGKMLDQVPDAVSFYGDLLTNLDGLQHFPANLIETLRERYRNRPDRVSRGGETHTQTHTHEHTHEHDHEAAASPVSAREAVPKTEAAAAAGDEPFDCGPPPPALVQRQLEDHAYRLWSEVAKDLGWPDPGFVNSALRPALALRLAEVGGIEGWIIALGKAREAQYLRNDDDTPKWWVNLKWFVDPGNFTGLMEGRYAERHRDNTQAGVQPGQGAEADGVSAAFARRSVQPG